MPRVAGEGLGESDRAVFSKRAGVRSTGSVENVELSFVREYWEPAKFTRIAKYRWVTRDVGGRETVLQQTRHFKAV